MQNDPGKERKTFFEPPPLLNRKRRNTSPEKPSDDTKIQETAEQGTCKVLTKFLTSQGLPLEAIQDKMFQNLFYSLNPEKIIPTPEILKKYMEKMGNPYKYQQALSKATGPLSVTIDVIEKENGDNYLAFSIHFFEGFEERKCLINLKKLLISEIEAESILTAVRRALSILNQDQIEISNFVVPNERIFYIFQSYNDVMKHQFISFHHFLQNFVESILKIESFSRGINQLREFVALVKMPWAYAKFQKLMNDEIPDIPNLDDQDQWHSTAVFLSKCLILHPKFLILAQKFIHKLHYVSIATFGKLEFLNQLLQQCIKHVRDLSGEHNSISQVIPTVMSIRNYIFESLSHGYVFEAEIKSRFIQTFQKLTSGQWNTKYQMATLLDPRFAYEEWICSNDTWTDIERAVIEEIVQNNETIEKRTEKIQKELLWYRRMCNDRPNESANPFEWWNSQKDNLENLVLIAREYLACPAVSIDAQQFFGSGGKFSNLVEIYDSERLESYLNCAGHHQQFRGHGSNIEHIPERETTKERQSAILPTSSNKIPEILPKDIKLEPVDLEDTVKDPIGIKLEPLDVEYGEEEPICHDTLHEEVNFEPFYDDYGLEKTPYFPQKQPINRKCVLCENLCPLESLKSVKNANEKLFLLLGGVLGNRFDASQASMKYFRHRPYSYYCRSHFQESCIEIFKELNVEKPENIMGCVEEQFNYILNLIVLIRKMTIDFEEAKSFVASMTEKYHNQPEAIAQDEEQETFEKNMKRRPSKRKEKCRFCLKSTVTSEMTMTPESYEELQKWIDILGEEFGRRLKLNGERNYVCKNHFSPNAFNKIGRRRRGVLPEIGLEKSQVTHQIDGDNFLKIEEPEDVDAPANSLRIDDREVKGETSEDVAASKPPGRPRGRPRKESRLEVPRPTIEVSEALESSEDVNYYEQLEEYTDSSEDEDSEHSEYTPDEDYDNEVPSRPRGRPRKYIKIEKEGVEEDSEDEQICRFCSEVVNKTEAFKGAKNRIRLSEWNKYLGVNFVRNLDYRDNNYVCKKHLKTDGNDLDRLPKQTTSSSQSWQSEFYSDLHL